MIPPFDSIPGLGTNAAIIVNVSKENFYRKRICNREGKSQKLLLNS